MATKANTSTTAAAAPQDNAPAKERKYLMTPDAFDNLDGQEYGGQSDVLVVNPGECAGPFRYIGHTQITTELGETTSHMAFDPEDEQVRLPLQATFLKAFDQARIGVGDTFALRRGEDQLKKKGKGAGKAMAIYSIRVIERAAVKQGANVQ